MRIISVVEETKWGAVYVSRGDAPKGLAGTRRSQGSGNAAWEPLAASLHRDETAVHSSNGDLNRMRPLIHFINEFNEIGGGERRAPPLELARLLVDHADVRLWSTGQPDPRLSGVAPIRHISLARSVLPRKVNLCLRRNLFPAVGKWIWLSQPRLRRIIVFNTPDVFGFNRLGTRGTN